MTTNEGVQDRLIRLTLGLFFFFLAMSSGFNSVWLIILAVVGVVLTVTGAVGFCPMYKIIKLDTCENR
jgi:hypothetical protein